MTPQAAVPHGPALDALSCANRSDNRDGDDRRRRDEAVPGIPEGWFGACPGDKITGLAAIGNGRFRLEASSADGLAAASTSPG
jgi:hypothetical protein